MMIPNNDNGWRHTISDREAPYRVVGWAYEEAANAEDLSVFPVIVIAPGYPTVAADGRTWHIDDEQVST